MPGAAPYVGGVGVLLNKEPAAHADSVEVAGGVCHVARVLTGDALKLNLEADLGGEGSVRDCALECSLDSRVRDLKVVVDVVDIPLAVDEVAVGVFGEFGVAAVHVVEEILSCVAFGDQCFCDVLLSYAEGLLAHVDFN